MERDDARRRWGTGPGGREGSMRTAITASHVTQNRCDGSCCVPSLGDSGHPPRLSGQGADSTLCIQQAEGALPTSRAPALGADPSVFTLHSGSHNGNWPWAPGSGAEELNLPREPSGDTMTEGPGWWERGSPTLEGCQRPVFSLRPLRLAPTLPLTIICRRLRSSPN